MDILTYAYLDNNIGDDLMVKLLAARFPEHRFLFHTSKSVVKRSFEKQDNVLIRPPSAFEEDLLTASLYLSIGGSIFQALGRRQKLYRIRRLRRLGKIRRQGLAVATLGSNLGPYSGRLGRKLIEWELQKNDLVTVRDQEAFDLVKSFRKIKKLVLADDIVYNLELADPAGDKAGGLGISAYRSIQTWENNADNYRFLAGLADAYIRRTGKPVTLFAFDTEKENDLAAAHQIYDMAKEKNKISIVPYLGDEEAFLAALQGCDRMVAIRFHAAILADVLQIPFLPISYSNKMENLLADRGYQGLTFRLEELTPALDCDRIAGEIESGAHLFTSFMGRAHSAGNHFEELAGLLDRL